MAFLNRCCAGCKVGSVIPRFENISKVRPRGDTGGAHYTDVPFPRLDPGNPDNNCNTASPGACGAWLVGGDLNGVSAQEIDDMVDDIMACGGAVDHNCYSQNGTVDMTASKLFGAQWILARKFWHGAFGWKSPDRCASGPSVGADQTKFLSFFAGGEWSNTAVSWDGDETWADSGNYSGTNAVDRLSGIATNTLSITEDGYFTSASNPSVNMTTLQNRNGVGFAISGGGKVYYTANMMPMGTDTRQLIIPLHNVNDFGCDSDGGGLPGEIWEAGGYYTDGIDASGKRFEVTFPVVGTKDGWSVTGSVDCYWNPSNDGVTWVGIGTTTVHINFTRNNSEVKYGYALHICDYVYKSFDDILGDFTGTLSDSYSATQCYEDFKALLAAWDMSNLNLARFRTDESLALAPLVIYDEVGPSAPVQVYQVTMDDYRGSLLTDGNGNPPGSVGSDPGQHDAHGRAPGDPFYSGGVDYLTTWPQTGYLDPRSYIWENPGGGFTNVPGTGGCQIKLGMRTGAIISHTQAGSDRHFWFGYSNLKRIVSDLGEVDWVGGSNGGFSDGNLPPVAMRWFNNEEAMYEPALGGNPGNYPQAFLTESGGVLRGAKFAQATQKWPAVNFGRPCGQDKYAVDQTTACCIASGDAVSGFTVKATGNATAPAASGGLAVNDYIFADGNGVYKISGITPTSPDGDGNPQWIVMVGGKLDDLPTGTVLSDGTPCLGRLRWPSAGGICGRAAITTTFASPTLTITPAAGLPYLRVDPATGALAVDIYDASMTLLVAGLALTRVSDTKFTATHAALPTAAWMTGAGVNWTKFDASSKRTGIHLDWSFNARAVAAGSAGPWYADVPGCTGGAVTQFNYSAGACPAVIGISPYYSPLADTGSDSPEGDDTPPSGEPLENFANQVIFDFPAGFAFDDLYGAHWQAAVMLTMPDPFWQTPFKPDCGGDLGWSEDDGSGEPDDDSGDTPVHYYAHHPLVEALKDIPAGDALPSGITLTYAHPIAPPYYPTGIPNAGGNYPSIETDWGFTGRACADIAGSGRFSGDYVQFVSC